MNPPVFPDSAAAVNSKGEYSVDMLPSAGIGARTSSEGDVQISLGIEGGFGQAWNAALSRVGALSLAWKNDADLAAQPKSAREIDPSLVFDGMRATSASQRSKASRASGASRKSKASRRSTQSTGHEPSLYKQTNDVITMVGTTGRTHDSHRWRSTTRHRSNSQTVTPIASRIEQQQSPDRTTDQRPSFHSRSRRISPTMDCTPTTCAGTDTISAGTGTGAGSSKSHRMSIRLERLLPHPRTPDPVSMSNTILISPRVARNQRILHGQGIYYRPKEACEVPQTLTQHAGLHRRTNSLPTPQNGNIRKSSLYTTRKTSLAAKSGSSMRHEGVFLSSLEDQISDMFTELGLTSPYTDDASGRAAGFQQSNIQCSEHIPWYHQSRYQRETAELAGRSNERPSIVLADDDSSCAENATDTTTLASGQGCLYTKGSIRSSPDISIKPRGRMRSAAADTHSIATGRTRPYEFVCLNDSAISSPRTHTYSHPVNNTVLGRIEQAGRFVDDVGHHASAVNYLLADLRAQSRALSETLLVSQSRASSLNHALASAIDAALGLASPDDGQDRVSRMARIDTRANNSLDQYSRFSKKMHLLESRAKDLRSKEHGGARTREDSRLVVTGVNKKETHVRSWLDNVAMTSTNAVYSASESEYDQERAVNQDDLVVDNATRTASRSIHTPSLTTSVKDPKRARKRGNRNHRRPVQPISVRIQRINKQWNQLQASIKDLGISSFQKYDPQSSGVDSEDTPELLNLRLASQITADSLKLIQRVLKATHETLDAVRSPPNTTNQ